MPRRSPIRRLWWSLLLPMFLVGMVSLPKMWPRKWTWRALTAVVLVGLLLLGGVVGSYRALRTLERRYLGAEQAARKRPRLGSRDPALRVRRLNP